MIQTVIVTRPFGKYDQASAFTAMIEKLGVVSRSLPVLEICRTEITQEDRDRISRLRSGHFSWLSFLSPAAVRVTDELFKEAGITWHDLASVKISAQGPGTASEIEERRGKGPDFIPSAALAEVLAEELLEIVTPRDRVLILQAAGGRGIVGNALLKAGIPADVIATYQTLPRALPQEARQFFHSCSPAETCIIFMSPSAVHATLAGIKEDQGRLSEMKILSIGPITSRAVREYGLNVWREARNHSEDGVLAMLLDAR